MGQSENYQESYFSPLLTSPRSLWKFPNPSLEVSKGIHVLLETHVKVPLTFRSVITNPVNRLLQIWLSMLLQIWLKVSYKSGLVILLHIRLIFITNPVDITN